jgi:hypothetical protein
MSPNEEICSRANEQAVSQKQRHLAGEAKQIKQIRKCRTFFNGSEPQANCHRAVDVYWWMV